MKKDFLFNKLYNFLIILGHTVSENIKNINIGGCCVYASILAKELEKYFPYFNINLKVAADFNYSNNIEEIRKRITKNTSREWYNFGIDFQHIVIEIQYKNNFIITDSENTLISNEIFNSVPYDGRKLYFYKGRLSIKDGIELSKDANNWCNFFDRDQIPKMQKIIKKEVTTFFNNYKNY